MTEIRTQHQERDIEIHIDKIENEFTRRLLRKERYSSFWRDNPKNLDLIIAFAKEKNPNVVKQLLESLIYFQELAQRQVMQAEVKQIIDWYIANNVTIETFEKIDELHALMDTQQQAARHKKIMERLQAARRATGR